MGRVSSAVDRFSSDVDSVHSGSDKTELTPMVVNSNTALYFETS